MSEAQRYCDQPVRRNRVFVRALRAAMVRDQNGCCKACGKAIDENSGSAVTGPALVRLNNTLPHSAENSQAVCLDCAAAARYCEKKTAPCA